MLVYEDDQDPALQLLHNLRGTMIQLPLERDAVVQQTAGTTHQVIALEDQLLQLLGIPDGAIGYIDGKSGRTYKSCVELTRFQAMFNQEQLSRRKQPSLKL